MAAALPDIGPKAHIDHDGYLAMYAPESDLDGFHSLHFTIKRTYTFEPDAMIAPTAWQRPLYTTDQYFEGADPFESSLRYESDLGPPKPSTDVIVNALCYAPGGDAIQARPSIRVGDHRHEIQVVGNRIAWQRAGGRIRFTPAESFSVIPIRYELAYGGVDRQHAMGPLMYAANPLGCGFLMAPSKDDPPRDRWTVLPNIEHPDRMLTPDTLLVPQVEREKWRVPAGFGWIPKHWEPRASRAGMPPGAKPLWKLLHGDKDPKGDHFPEMKPDFWNGAPPGLAVPRLDGHEKITLRHLHRDREDLVLRLPITKPKLRVAINTAAQAPVTLTLATVQIEVETQEVTLNWRGTVRPNLPDLDALKRVLMEIDGEIVLPAPLIGTGFPLDLLTGDFPGPDIIDMKGIPKPGGA